MRTTLKRGIGRSATTNGNGRAVLPPAIAEPVRRYRQPKVERGFLYYLSWMFAWLIISILTVALGLAGGVYLLFHEAVADVRAHSSDVKVAQERLDLPLPDKPAIALIVGLDERKKGIDADGTKRSDTLLLLRADPKQRALSLLSFPRDLLVQIQCPNKPTYTGRINEAVSYCGTQGALETVKGITGLPINYLVTVNFVGFVRLVAELGGVWMDIDQRYYNPEGTGYATIDLHPGYQKLNGRQALDFVRYRHTDSDIYRLARQQSFIHAFKSQLAGSFSVGKLLKVVGVVRDNLEIGAKGGRIDGRTVKRWGLFAFDLPSGHVFQTKIDQSCYGERYDFALTVDDGCISQAVEDFSRPDVEASEKATAEALGRKPRIPGPPPDQTTLVVLNGNGVAGAAADASYQLAQKGYQTLEPANGALANAPTQDYTRTKVYYNDLDPKASLAAKRMVTLLGGAKDVDTASMPVAIAPLAGEAMVAVVLGQNFDGTVLGAGAREAPTRQPPKVRKDPDEARAAVLQARKQVRFPVVLPKVIEEGSHLSTNEGVRVYKTGGHPAVRLTFVTDVNEYWGIQMVPWRDAPALKGPNEVVKIKGREYALYYSGLKLQMVVFRHQGNTYWVTNTLLGTLSNETMLAIAKGLQPLKPR